MVMKPALPLEHIQPAQQSPSNPPYPSTPSVETSQQATGAPSDLSYQINEAIQSRSSSNKYAQNAASSAPGPLRDDDSDSDWDASDREDDIPRAAKPQSHRASNPQYDPPPGPPPGHPPSLTVGPPPGPPPGRAPLGADADGLHLAAEQLHISGQTDAQQSPSGASRDRTHTNPFLRKKSESNTQTNSGSSALHPQHMNPFAQPQSDGEGSLAVPESSTNVSWIDAQTTGSLYAVSSANTSPPAPDTHSPATWHEPGPESSAAVAASLVQTETPEELLAKQKNAFYSIKKIRWRRQKGADDSSEVPILVQNANGPCPLLALVNALVLSTAPGQESTLVSQLWSRETISLGLLIDSIIDDFISKRRPSYETSQKLPDLAELYRFLVNLHTGMNVNPRFVPKEEPLIGGAVPGTFEQTLDVNLYGTFAMPLLHGWLPDVEEPAYAAFQRSAPSYEDAQNLLFYEEELEHKLSTQQLSSEDEAKFMDLSTIKQFLAAWRTQLTPTGLTVMRDSLGPNQMGILFRNDHFSTIFKEPVTGDLYNLVTDAGYAPHKEIVFESLVDINGSQGNFYSGDYSLVNSLDENGRAAVDDSTGWTTVQRRPGNNRNSVDAAAAAGAAGSRLSNEPSAGNSAPQTAAEQEDADLALAMQLQEEEEERQRNEQASRRREEELSQRFLSQDSHQGAPDLPPRRGASMNASRADAGVVGRGDGDSLPTYEQAAASQPFVPPAGHPASAAAPRRSNGAAEDTGYSGRSTQSGRRRQTLVDQIPGRNGMGRTQYATTHESTGERREGCIVM